MPMKRLKKPQTIFFKYFISAACLAAPVLFICAPALMLGGCASAKPAQQKAAPEKPREDYSEVLNRWTRSAKVYAGVESRLYISATYKNLEYRKAYVDLYARSYVLDEAAKKAMLDREKEIDEQYNEFFVAAFTPAEQWNDFDAKGSVWKIFLEDSAGNRLVPISVKKVNSYDPVIRELFPYWDPWSYGYVVKFPKYSESASEPIPGKGTKSLRLVATGILGEGELKWELKR